MQGYNFTERVRKVLAMTREAAVRLQHEYVDTQHILLGLIREGDGVAVAVLQNLHGDLGEIERRVERQLKQGQRSLAVGPDLPYTVRAKKVLELAMAEARDLNHQYVGTEHLLLGLLREETGLAGQVLKEVGVELRACRTETLRLLGTETSQVGGRLHSRDDVRGLRPIGFTLRVECEGGRWYEERFLRTADLLAFLQSLPPESNQGGDFPRE
jgi:ATP-dependent Clp protease ATP-binding subunit ClpC